VYKIKTNPKDNTQKQMAKSILNNLMGRFGIRLEKSVTKILSLESYRVLVTRRAVISEKYLGNDKFLVTYLPMLDLDIISDLGLDIVKIASKQRDEEKQDLDVVSVPISAAITAYGRIHISKLKMKVMSMGGNIYYSDTDSLVTDILLPESMVSSSELGLLKLEHVIIKGIFNNNKTY
jgi:DNA polymerase type B, organellar and viral